MLKLNGKFLNHHSLYLKCKAIKNIKKQVLACLEEENINENKNTLWYQCR